MKTRIVNFFVRIFPQENRHNDCVRIDNDGKTLFVRNVLDYDSKRPPRSTFWKVPTDGILSNVCQETVYKQVCEGVIESAFNGTDSIILACGQSGTGKTYTLTGIQSKYEYRGIVPRLVSDIFIEQKAKKSLLNISFSISIVEAADKHLYDLLREPAALCSNVENYKKVDIKTSEEALKLVFDAEYRRKVENVSTNCGTSVTTIHVKCLSLVLSDSTQFCSKIHIVDTGGLDTVWKKRTKSETCQASVNSEKMFLQQFFLALKSANFSLPGNRRKCQLTKYLQCSLPNSHLRVLAHIRTSRGDLDVTTSTLKFGLMLKSKCRRLQLVGCERPGTTAVLNTLEDELNRLKDEILVGRMLNGEYERSTVSRHQMEHVLRLADLFLSGGSTEKSVLSIVEPTLLLTVIRDKYQQVIKSMKGERDRSVSEQPEQEGVRQKPSRSVVSKREDFRRGKRGSRRSLTGSQSRKQVVPAGRSVSAPHPNDLPEEAAQSTSPCPTRDVAWVEFAQKSPDIVLRLSTAERAMEDAKIERDGLMEKMIELIEQSDAAKMELEFACYERFAAVGNTVGPDGTLYKSKDELDKKNQLSDIRSKLEETKDRLENTHAEFVEKHKTFLQARTEAEVAFQEYCSTIYVTILVPPHLEEPKFEPITSSTQVLGISAEEKLFKNLQRCRKRTTPYITTHVGR